MTKDRQSTPQRKATGTNIQGAFSFAQAFQKYGGRYALFDIRNAHNDKPRSDTLIEIVVLCHDVRKAGNKLSVLISPVFGEGNLWVGATRLRIIDQIPPEYLKPKTKMMYDLSSCKPKTLEAMSG